MHVRGEGGRQGQALITVSGLWSFCGFHWILNGISMDSEWSSDHSLSVDSAGFCQTPSGILTVAFLSVDSAAFQQTPSAILILTIAFLWILVGSKWNCNHSLSKDSARMVGISNSTWIPSEFHLVIRVARG